MILRRYTKKNWIKATIGIGIAIVCVIFIYKQTDGPETLAALEAFKPQYLILGILFLVVGYTFKVIRWSILLNTTGSMTTIKTCTAPFLASIALNNILPFRFGDVIRAIVFPSAIGVSKTTATSSLIIERLLDLLTLITCLAIGLHTIKSNLLPPALVTASIGLAISGSIVLCSIFLLSAKIADYLNRRLDIKHGPSSLRIYQISKTLIGVLRNFHAMTRPRILISIFTLSMLAWIGEAGLFYFILLGSGLNATSSTALLIMSVVTLSTLMPSSPGYIGSFHLAAFIGINIIGGNNSQALSFAIIVHLALWSTTTSAGAIAMWFNSDIFNSLMQLLKSKHKEIL